MKISTFILSFTLSLLTLTTLAQERKSIFFYEKTHDFGTIDERDGEVSCDFYFRNDGTEAVSIKEIHTSCGCTSPEWDEKPILPNKRGKITLTFDPKERYGDFDKGATILFESMAGRFYESVSIVGTVKFPERTIEEYFPYDLGNDVLVSDRFFVFGTVQKGDNKSQIIEIYNSSDKPLTLTVANQPRHLSTEFSPKILPPKERGYFTFVCFTAAMQAWGHTADSLYIVANGKKAKESVEYRINLCENFSKMTAKEKVEAPIIVVSPRELDLDTVKIGTRKKATISIKNAGEQPLIIRKVSSDSDYLTAKVRQKTIKGGKNGILEIEIDATALQPFDFQKRIQIISNDPTHSVIDLYIKWITAN